MSSEVERRKAQSKKATSKGGQKQYDGSNFVECNMSVEDKAHFRSNGPASEAVADWLDRMFRDGYKLSLSYSLKNDCYQAFLTCGDAENKCYNLCLSARAAGMPTVLAVLYYKSVVMLDGVWTAEIGREYEPDRLG